MITYRNEAGYFIIEGLKNDSNSQPAIGAVVKLIKEDTAIQYGETTTQLGGYWSFKILDSVLPSGKYIIQFYGSRLVPKLPPLGDWELFDIMGPDLFDPIEPADVQGLLRETITRVNASITKVEYSVAVNATKIIVTNDGLSTITGVNLQFIDQHKATLLTPENFDVAYQLTDANWNCDRTEPYDLLAGEKAIYTLTTAIISSAYKVKFTGIEFGNPNLTIKITSRLAADEIDAGRIRVEKGISISSNGVSGFVIDNVSLRGIDGSSNIVVALYNTGQTVGTLSNIYAKLGGWAITSDRIVRSETGYKIELVGTTTPYIGVGNGTTEYARIGYLSSGVNGIWGTVGGFGGTSYTTATVFINNDGLQVNDSNLVSRAFLGITPISLSDADGWRDYTNVAYQSSELITDGDFETILGASWSVSNPTYVYISTVGSVHSPTHNLHIDYEGVMTGTPIPHWAARELTTILANTTYTFSYYHNHNGYSGLTTTLERWNGTSWDILQIYNLAPSPPAGNYHTITYFSGANTSKIRIKFLSAASVPGWYVALDDVSCKKYEYFTDISQQGVFIFNSPSSYIKIGKGKSEFFGEVQATNLVVTGNFTVYGTTVISGPSIVASPIQVLNNGATLPTTFSGIEIDNTAGNNPMLMYNVSANNWGIFQRTAGTTGDQAGTFSAFDKIIVQSDVDKIYNETYVAVSNITAGTPIVIPNSKSYNMGSNKLLVFINGVLQRSGATYDYQEASTTTVTFNYNLFTNAKITFYILGW
ncbi:MAG: hypothetical protein WC666_03265 [Candidatus Paceibacterota bacterium]|jgi:hypothetical protein